MVPGNSRGPCRTKLVGCTMLAKVSVQDESCLGLNGGWALRAGWKFAFLAVGIVLPAFGGTIAFTPPGVFIPGSGAPVNLGMVFTANSTFSIDALGFYNFDGVADGIVAIYDGSGGLLTSTTVTLLDPLVDGYFYKTISPITLTSGSQYVVDEFSSNGIWSFGDEPTTSAEITFNYHDYTYASGLAFPTISFDAAGSAYYGPNFWIASETAAPEPSTLSLLVPGLLALLGVAARQRFNRFPHRLRGSAQKIKRS
jgi:hypothetical protein